MVGRKSKEGKPQSWKKSARGREKEGGGSKSFGFGGMNAEAGPTPVVTETTNGYQLGRPRGFGG